MNSRLEWVWKIFDSMVGGGLCYGGEVWVWGSKLLKNKINAFGFGVNKELLGVGNAILNEGTLKELGRVFMGSYIEKRGLSYAFNLKYRGGKRKIQYLCLKTAMDESRTRWAKWIGI